MVMVSQTKPTRMMTMMVSQTTRTPTMTMMVSQTVRIRTTRRRRRRWWRWWRKPGTVRRRELSDRRTGWLHYDKQVREAGYAD